MLTITKLNETYVRVQGPNDELQTLADELTFEVPGAKFSPRVQSGMWDGRIRLLNRMTGQVYLGLVPKLVQLCIEFEIEVKVDPSIRPKPVNRSTIVDFIDSLDLPFEPHDFQYDAVAEAISRKRLLVISPTSSGKSLIIYLIVRFLGVKTLIVCPRKTLVKQLRDDFIDYGYKGEVHMIMEGAERYSDLDIVITTYHSMLKVDSKYLNGYDVLIADEVHLFDSKEISKIVEKATDVSYRIGLTGTLKGSKTHELALTGLFGPQYTTITTREMIDRKISSDVDVRVIILKHPPSAQALLGKKHEYTKEKEIIAASKARNNFIRALVAQEKGNTLILFRKIEKHGDLLVELLRKDSKPCYYIHGKVDTEERDQYCEIIENSEGNNLVASSGTFSTGVSVNNIQKVIQSDAIKSRVDLFQSIGRGLRKDGKANKVVWIDLADYFERKGDRSNPHGYSYRHLQERLAMYMEVGLPYTITEITLPESK